MLDRLDFLLGIRVRGRPLIIGATFLGVLVFSLLLFLFEGNGKVVRVLFLSCPGRRGMVAEERLLPRHRVLEQDVTDLAEGVLLGPTRHDALRIFPGDVPCFPPSFTAGLSISTFLRGSSWRTLRSP